MNLISIHEKINLLARVEAEGACESFWIWLELNKSLDLDYLPPRYYLWAAGRIKGFPWTPERLDICAVQEPWVALEYAAAQLTEGRRSYCIDRAPLAAILYNLKGPGS